MKARTPSEAFGTFGLVKPDELAGLAEVAAICKVSKDTALKYARRPDFPAPLDRLASGPVWRRADIEAWAAKTLPLRTGRPPKQHRPPAC
jgi:predicted DNA-binding transcriptional regulator AlpA